MMVLLVNCAQNKVRNHTQFRHWTPKPRNQIAVSARIRSSSYCNANPFNPITLCPLSADKGLRELKNIQENGNVTFMETKLCQALAVIHIVKVEFPIRKIWIF